MPHRAEPLPSAMAQIHANGLAKASISHGSRRNTILPDKDLFAAQAYMNSGIGNFVCQGLAKRGYSSNPRSPCYSPGATMKTLRQELQSHGAAPADHVDESAEIFNVPAYEYENFNKDDVFKTASRRTRCTDMDHASKWAALSFFESDPYRVAHHLEVRRF